jgi:uncharacterized SAM-binding protein YcdF (DUF218 family)
MTHLLVAAALLLVGASPAAPVADAALVLSGDVKELRTRRAVELLKAGQVGAILLTGSGQGGDSAAYLREVALKLGAPSERLVLETRSTTTEENIQNAAPLIRSHRWQSVALVTSAFHMRRALWLARRELPEVRWLPVAVEDAGLENEATATAGEWLKLALSWLRGWI